MFWKKKQTDNTQKLEEIRNELRTLSILSTKKLLSKLETDATGLTSEEVEERLEEYGKNVIEVEKTPAWYKSLWVSFNTPFNFILIALMIVSYFTSDKETVLVMGLMIAISTFLRFWQERKAILEADSLKKMVNNKAGVIRRIIENGKTKTKEIDISIEDVVPGDIIHLSAGDMIPADVRLIKSKDLFISQSALTGEALPVEKHETFKKFQHSAPLQTMVEEPNKEAEENKEKFNELDQPNVCFMGSSVVSGSAHAVVLTTGSRTFFGTMAQQLLGKRPETAFDQGVDKISKLLVKFMLIMAPLVFLLNGFISGDWTDSFLFGISVAVGLTPEMLPMIVNSCLAKGAYAMSKKKTVVKQLSAIQNFGAINVLCTDKTGTLTQDQVVLIRHLDAHGEKSKNVLECAYLNSHFQTGLKNLLDKAVISKAEEINITDVRKRYKLIDEIPFDFVRRRMSVILEDSQDQSRTFFCKGAVEEILENCSQIDEGDGIIKPFTQQYADEVINLKDQLSEDGLRVVAVAYKKLNDWTHNEFSVKDENNLIFVGYVAFLDPPKESTTQALELLQERGVAVKVLTGDNALVARKICKEVGLPADSMITGPELDDLSEEKLADVVQNITIFAKLSPMHKARIVKKLKSLGNTVGFMGDGINDALALREADVGISVDTGTDLAKEAADIILLEKSLLVLEEGVREGRVTFGNIIKYIKITCSSNFGNVFSVLVASATLPFLPMMPVQLLIQNLMYDISQTVIPWDKMDDEFLEKPKTWEANSIIRFMLIVGPISSLFDIITFIVMWFVFKANCDAQQAVFHTGWFCVGLITQTLVVHMIRTEKIPFIKSTAAYPLILLTSIVILCGIMLPYTSFATKLGFTALPLGYFPWLIGITFAYCILTQIVKIWYIKKFKSWL